MKKLKKHLDKFNNPRILDAATGQGTFMAMIASVYADFVEMIGIDTSDRAVEAVNKNFKDPRIKVLKMDVDNMTFNDGYFDVSCLSNSMHHMADIGHTISEMARVTKTGGILVFNEMKSDNEDEKQMTHTHMHHFWAEIDRMNGIIHNETMTGDEILNTLKTNPEINLIDSWELEYIEDQEMTDEAYAWLKNTIDVYIKRADGKPGYEDIVKKADGLKKRLDETGFRSATQIITIAEKI